MSELYLATAEKVGNGRVQANPWMLSMNSAIVADAHTKLLIWPGRDLAGIPT